MSVSSDITNKFIILMFNNIIKALMLGFKYFFWNHDKQVNFLINFRVFNGINETFSSYF
jgi:hypothetical protein